MRTFRLVAVTSAAACLLVGVLAPPSSSTAEVSPVPCPSMPAVQDPRNPAFYDFVHTYRSCNSSFENYGRVLPDQTVTTTIDGRVTVSVTTSTSLAGAIASVKVAGKEYIASGGHGSALQYAFHAWHAGASASECYNPTQAGSRLDDANTTAPFHGSSTSFLYRMTRSGTTISTASRPAMFIEATDGDPGWNRCQATDYQPDRWPFTEGLSPYRLETTIRMAPDHGLGDMGNAIQIDATLHSEDDLYAEFDAVLVAYLQRDFTATYLHDPASGELAAFSGDRASVNSPVRCTQDGVHCFGIYRHAGGYYYTMTRSPNEYNGYTGEQTVQITSPTANVGAGGTTELRYRAFIVVGNRDQVATTLTALARQAR